MAVISIPLASGKTVHYVKFKHLGVQHKKRIGFDKQHAERVNERQKRERAENRFRPDAPTKLIRLKPWLSGRLNARKGRASEGEKNQVTDHVMSQEWFMTMRVCDVTPPDIRKVIETIRESKKLGESSITNIHSVLSGCFQWAVFDGLLETNPCKGLPKGVVIRGQKKKRVPYSRTEARTIMACGENMDSVRMWLYLAFYTGMREGEVCGRRWKDWKANGEPLGALHIHDQYNCQPLKTADLANIQARWVPVHKNLERMLTYWWEEGFELTYCRQPTLDDFIVPARSGNVLTRTAAYKMFRSALKRAGVENKTLHSTRHTFISVARAGTLRHDMVERITHNAKGTTLDQYTHAEYDTLCEIINGVDYSVDKATVAGFLSGGPPKRKELVEATPTPGIVLGAQYGHSTKIEFAGKCLTVTGWEAETGIPRKTICDRLNLGWSIERALTTPIDTRRSRRAPGVVPQRVRGIENQL